MTHLYLTFVKGSDYIIHGFRNDERAVFKLYSCTRKENKNTNHISFMYKDGSVIVPCTDGTAVVVIV